MGARSQFYPTQLIALVDLNHIGSENIGDEGGNLFALAQAETDELTSWRVRRGFSFAHVQRI